MLNTGYKKKKLWKKQNFLLESRKSFLMQSVQFYVLVIIEINASNKYLEVLQLISGTLMFMKPVWSDRCRVTRVIIPMAAAIRRWLTESITRWVICRKNTQWRFIVYPIPNLPNYHLPIMHFVAYITRSFSATLNSTLLVALCLFSYSWCCSQVYRELHKSQLAVFWFLFFFKHPINPPLSWTRLLLWKFQEISSFRDTRVFIQGEDLNRNLSMFLFRALLRWAGTKIFKPHLDPIFR